MLNLNLLDSRTYNFLIAVGWQENRKIDISDLLVQLENEGYVSFTYAEEILTNLGGLYLRPDIKVGNRMSGEINFDPLDIGIAEYCVLKFTNQK